MTPAERTMRARIAAHASWKNETDRTERTRPARMASLTRFEREVDPDGVLQPVDRAKRAESARREYMTRLAYKSVRARRRREGH